jgi:hypothetical protein
MSNVHEDEVRPESLRRLFRRRSPASDTSYGGIEPSD